MLEFANIANPDQFTPLAVYDTGAEFSGLDENLSCTAIWIDFV